RPGGGGTAQGVEQGGKEAPRRKGRTGPVRPGCRLKTTPGALPVVVCRLRGAPNPAGERRPYLPGRFTATKTSGRLPFFRSSSASSRPRRAPQALPLPSGTDPLIRTAGYPLTRYTAAGPVTSSNAATTPRGTFSPPAAVTVRCFRASAFTAGPAA